MTTALTAYTAMTRSVRRSNDAMAIMTRKAARLVTKKPSNGISMAHTTSATTMAVRLAVEGLPSALTSTLRGAAGRPIRRRARVRPTLRAPAPVAKLLGDALSYQLRVHLRLADFEDVQGNFAACALREVRTELLDIGAFFADDHARTRGVHGHFGVLSSALNDHLADAGGFQLVLHVFAQLEILDQTVGIVPIRKPAGVPCTVDTDADTDWINLLTHKIFS